MREEMREEKSVRVREGEIVMNEEKGGLEFGWLGFILISPPSILDGNSCLTPYSIETRKRKREKENTTSFLI